MPPLSIVSSKDGKLVFNEEQFEILTKLRPFSSKVLVLNIAGSSRQGRSFMLNLIAKFLRENDWSAQNLKENLTGFDWGKCTEPLTAGVLVWDEIFEITTPSGERAGVIIMDSQGVFDARSDLQTSVEILLFTLLTSSMQIYNVSQNLSSQDFCNIQLAVRYAKHVSNGSASFNDLLFLVRDWQNLSQAPFGLEGGRRFLQRCALGPGAAKGPVFGEDPQQARNEVEKAFKSIECFLMPHPGLKAATSESFHGWISELEPLFVENLKAFVACLFSENRLKTLFAKRGGRCFTFDNFLNNVKQYGKLCASENIHDFGTFFNVDVREKSAALCAKTIELYVLAMEGFLSSKRGFVPWEEHERLHHNAAENALIQFARDSKLCDAILVNDMTVFVRSQIEEKHEKFIKRNRTASQKAR